MRNIIIGIIIGIVVGIMTATTFVAPGLEEARKQSEAPKVEGAEQLDIDSAPSDKPPAPPAMPVTQDNRLRVMSPYPPHTPILGDLVRNLQQDLPTATGGHLGLSLINSSSLNAEGELMDAVGTGAVDGVFATPQDLDGSSNALKLFTAIPFGPDNAEYLAWFRHGGGQELLDEIMSKRGLKATLCGLLPSEGGGWFREPVRKLEDFAQLNIRAEGFSAQVLSELGARTTADTPADILIKLEQDELHGLEYSIPSIDRPLGFQKFARNFYFPGWHQPLTSYVLAINSEIWEKLPAAQQDAIAGRCAQNLTSGLSAAEAEQFETLKKLTMDGIQMRRWPEEILDGFGETWKNVTRDHVQNDREFAKIWSSLQQFRRDYAIWEELANPN